MSLLATERSGQSTVTWPPATGDMCCTCWLHLAAMCLPNGVWSKGVRGCGEKEGERKVWGGVRVRRECGAAGLRGGKCGRVCGRGRRLVPGDEAVGAGGTKAGKGRAPVKQRAPRGKRRVRGIAAVTSAVAKGDLSKQIDVDANGEILDLKNTVNGMVLRLRTLAVEVTRVTLEVVVDLVQPRKPSKIRAAGAVEFNFNLSANEAEVLE
ncbi:hypothetical protein B0H16DRAFT_1465039 [Mycena metata]|uniref:HAMP domain-containing protein n=1 Tax=Mycena metata TaxID=1033252 RepID=A0AAD7GQ56_9AGAR|nr:hypothetical protein B0H16DRAFT_1705178 [Mycena metata]KAJ7740161.1 hypothetical protein B0H16DRAFT_1465039 [Mycena metata]